MDTLSKLFSKPYLIRYGVLLGMWIVIQIAASISANHTLAEEKAMLATLQPIASKEIDGTSPALPQPVSAKPKPHKGKARHLHGVHHPTTSSRAT